MKKPKGGRGYADELRNEALVILNTFSKEKFGPRPLGRLFKVRPQTIAGILDRDTGKYAPSGVIHS